MKIKVAELEGARLDMWVAKALGWKQALWGRGHAVWVQADDEGRFRCNVAGWKPSTDWAQAGPIIERERISIYDHDTRGNWLAFVNTGAKYIEVIGSTPLIAVMRCYVSSKFGEEVDE